MCAQALCLEHMLGRAVPTGALFYGQTRRRKDVAFDAALRALTLDTIADTRAMLHDSDTPAARYDAKRCDACSLIDVCQPRLLDRGSVDQWVRRQLNADED